MSEESAESEVRSDAAVAVGLIALSAGAAALVTLGLPVAARPMISVVAALSLVAVTFVAVRRLLRGAAHVDSPFDRRPHPPPRELPSELEQLLGDLERETASNQPLPKLFADRLRRCAMRRVRERFGTDLRRDEDWRQLASEISPQLYLLLIGEELAVPGHRATALVDEVERL